MTEFDFDYDKRNQSFKPMIVSEVITLWFTNNK